MSPRERDRLLLGVVAVALATTLGLFAAGIWSYPVGWLILLGLLLLLSHRLRS